MKKGAWIVQLLFLILGLYLINSGLEFLAMPEIILGIEKWILVIAGLFLLYALIPFSKAKKHHL